VRFQRSAGSPCLTENAPRQTPSTARKLLRAEQRPRCPPAPTGVAIFANDFQSIRRFADRDHANIVSWNHFDRGSHFSPHDAPDLLVDDIRQFFRSLR
jgi:hypothetical protein